VLENKCSGKYLDPRGMKLLNELRYYMIRNFMIYTGHLICQNSEMQEAMMG
jgi:hypothetical protein